MSRKFLAVLFLLGGVSQATPVGSLPSSFDWRDKLGGLSPVGNQGACGSCWAFASTAAMETLIKIRRGDDIRLSAQYVLSCNGRRWSCEGGDFPLDFAVTGGFVLESEFPYIGQDVPCQNGVTPVVRAASFHWVAKQGSPTTDALKQAILDHGLVMTTVYANDALAHYQGGVFHGCESGAYNKLVNLVGWNDAGEYWIARNTWGTEWGEDGYFRIPYGCNQIGAKAAYYELAN